MVFRFRIVRYFVYSYLFDWLNWDLNLGLLDFRVYVFVVIVYFLFDEF